jgi:mRNA-degrading endonuclease RelE of RelBE toxin-antitoxin system
MPRKFVRLDAPLQVTTFRVTLYRVEYAEGVEGDLHRMRAFDRNSVLDAIDDQLTRVPTEETGHRKRLEGVVPPFEDVDPVWQLAVGEFRVFYDVREPQKRVTILAVRRKPPHKTTKDIL